MAKEELIEAARTSSHPFLCQPFLKEYRQLNKKLYVGNMSYDVTNDDLERAFSAHGTVQTVQLMKDRDTGQSKGFAFVEMGSGSEAHAAMTALNNTELKGRALTVNEARPQPEGGRGGRSGGSGAKRGGGYGGGGGGYGGGRRY